MLRIGITGGIGSGKSTIAKFFAKQYDVPLYLMDDRSKYVIANNQELRMKLIKQFGSDVFSPDGVYNTKLVASVVFADELELVKLTNTVGEYVQILNYLI